MSKLHRKVTVDNSKSVRDSSTGSRRRQSVFDRLGPGGGRERLSTERPETCRNWLRDRRCPYGNQCLFQHSLSSTRDKRVRGERSPDSRRDKLHVEDLRYKQEKSRHRSSHKDKDVGESSKSRSCDISPHMLIRKNRSPDSDTPPPDWDNPVELPETDDWEGNEGLLDFERELTLEMRRQQLQRELELEIEKEKREKENESVVIEKQMMSDESPPARRKRPPYSPSPPPCKNRDKHKERHTLPDLLRESKGLRTPSKEASHNKKGGATSHFIMDSPPSKCRYKSPVLRKGPHTPSPPHPEESIHIKKKKKKVPGLKNKETSKKNKTKNLPVIESQEIHQKKKYRSPTPPPPPPPKLKVKRKVHSPSPSTSANSQRSYSPRQRSLSPRRRSPVARKKKSPLLKKYSAEKHCSPKRVEKERKLSPFPEKVKKKTSRPNSHDSRSRDKSQECVKRYKEDKVVDRVERKGEKYREEALIRKERESRRDEWERKQEDITRQERQHERQMELPRRKLREERMREERISPFGGRRSHRESPASQSTSSLEGDHREPKMASKIIPTPIKRRRYPPDLRDNRYPPDHLRDELRESRYPPRKYYDGERGFKSKIPERPGYRGYVPGGNDRGLERGKIRPPYGKFESERDIKHSTHFKGQTFKRKHSDLEDLSGSESPFRKRRRSGERRESPQITSEVPRIARLGRTSMENSPAARRREEKEERHIEKEKTSETVEERLPAEEVFSDWSNASEDSLIEASSAKSRSNSAEQDDMTDHKQTEESKLKLETERLSSRNSSRTNSKERLGQEHNREKDSVKDNDQEKDRETKKIFESFIEQERILRGRSPSIGSTSSRHSSVGSEYKRWEGRTHRDSDRSDKKEDMGRGRESDREGDIEKIKSKLEVSGRERTNSKSEGMEVISRTSECGAKDNSLNTDNVGLEKREIVVESESVSNKSPGEVAELLIENDYEEISDDEFDAMIEDDSNREKSEEQSSQIETVDVLDVDFASLIKDSECQSQEPGTALKRFSPGNVLTTIGVSKVLAGPQIIAEIHEVCLKSLPEERLGSKLKLFESDLGALNATSMKRQKQRARLFTDIGPCRHALCARRDMAIRKQLRKSDK
ncbi:uncharacterized protein LOC100374861, partial [Saccoglossus kowalevskii]